MRFQHIVKAVVAGFAVLGVLTFASIAQRTTSQFADFDALQRLVQFDDDEHDEKHKSAHDTDETHRNNNDDDDDDEDDDGEMGEVLITGLSVVGLAGAGALVVRRRRNQAGARMKHEATDEAPPVEKQPNLIITKEDIEDS